MTIANFVLLRPKKKQRWL